MRHLKVRAKFMGAFKGKNRQASLEASRRVAVVFICAKNKFDLGSTLENAIFFFNFFCSFCRLVHFWRRGTSKKTVLYSPDLALCRSGSGAACVSSGRRLDSCTFLVSFLVVL
jgi:hypothetical protein